MSTISTIDNAKTAKSLSDHNNACYEGTLDENKYQVAFTPFEDALTSKAHTTLEKVK